MIIPMTDLKAIAHEASELQTVSPLDSTGYYVIWKSADDPDVNVAVDICKGEDCYAIWISPSDIDAEGEWVYTDTMTKKDLVAELQRIAGEYETLDCRG